MQQFSHGCSNKGAEISLQLGDSLYDRWHSPVNNSQCVTSLTSLSDQSGLLFTPLRAIVLGYSLVIELPPNTITDGIIP